MISPQVEWDHLRRLRAERLAQGAERTARAAHAVAAIPQSCDPAPVSIEIEARELTAPRLAACLREHGCALIRGLIPTDITAQVRSLIDHVFNAADHGPASSDLYDPLLDLATMKPDDRKWVRSGGAVLTADSPRALNDVAGLLTQFGLVDQILPTGTPGSLHAWDIAPDQVRAHFGGQESWTPAFNPGDVLIFDHMSVHRTHQSPDMREVRYALECWTFAPDHFPNTQTPVALSFA
jgi:hypothetical protein